MRLFNSTALLSQWKPRDATVNFDTYRNLQRHRCSCCGGIYRHNALVQDSVPRGYNCIPLSAVCTARLQRTWLNCVCPSLRQKVVVVGFGPPQPATWWGRWKRGTVKRGTGKRGTLKVWKAWRNKCSNNVKASAVVATVSTPVIDGNDCEVCLIAQRDERIAFVPCGHRRFCETCAEVERQGRGCPICRTAIQMIMRLFWPVTRLE